MLRTTNSDDEYVALEELVAVMPLSGRRVDTDSWGRVDATVVDVAGGDDGNTADDPASGGDRGPSGPGLHVAAFIEAYLVPVVGNLADQ
jgi:hypothetical protein